MRNWMKSSISTHSSSYHLMTDPHPCLMWYRSTCTLIMCLPLRNTSKFPGYSVVCWNSNSNNTGCSSCLCLISPRYFCVMIKGSTSFENCFLFSSNRPLKSRILSFTSCGKQSHDSVGLC